MDNFDARLTRLEQRVSAAESKAEKDASLLFRVRDGLSEDMDARSSDQGEFRVLLTAVLSLVESHPAPERFAERFRAQWLTHFEEHEGGGYGQHYLGSMRTVLALLEQTCPAPLQIRAPR